MDNMIWAIALNAAWRSGILDSEYAALAVAIHRATWRALRFAKHQHC